MGFYILRRLIYSLPTLFGATLVVFLILRLGGGDAAVMIAGPDASLEEVEQVRERLGLTKPLHTQYFDYLKSVARGDFGYSLRAPRLVVDELVNRLPATLELAVVGIAIAVALGIVAGVISALWQYSWVDHIAMVISLIGISVPRFWSGLLLMIFFSHRLGWFPISGRGGPLWTLEGLSHIVLPATALGLFSAAQISRLTRSAMLEVIRQDYIRTAMSKGLSGTRIVIKHAVRNALIPVITVIGIQFGYLLGGTVLIETVYAWPGMGRLIVQSIWARDYPVVQTAILFLAIGVVTINLLVDVAYGLIDPRIRYE